MPGLIDKLHRDHINMSELLELIAGQLSLMQNNSADVDYPMMRDIARYFMSFPDTVHHPLEDEIFALLELKRPDLKGELAIVRDDHREIAELGMEFYRLMEAVCSEHVVARSAIVSAAENFLARQQGHLNLEESEIFSAATEALSDDDLAAYELEHGGKPDPIFATELREGFTRLHDAVVAARG